MKKKEKKIKFQEGNDFYFDEMGLMVLTEAYHRKRGFCCGNTCKHCPYDHENVLDKQITDNS